VHGLCTCTASRAPARMEVNPQVVHVHNPHPPSNTQRNQGGGEATLTPNPRADRREDDPDETPEGAGPFSEESEQWFAEHLAKAPPISEEQARDTIRIIALATSKPNALAETPNLLGRVDSPELVEDSNARHQI
jgi:hypothetical protein